MKIIHRITCLVFLLIIFGFFLLFLLSPKGEMSVSERRKLAQLPQFSLQTLIDGSFFKGFDRYTTDQFPLRDGFRTVGAHVRADLLRQKDVNGLYLHDGVVFKSDYPLKPQNIDHFTAKTDEIHRELIAGRAENYWVSVIPDKSLFDPTDHLKTDPTAVADRFSAGLTEAEYIDIFPALSLDSYYKTDTHWSQDKLFGVMEIFAQSMGFTAPDQQDYTPQVITPFYGVYWGQSALNPQPDSLCYLESGATRSATVENPEKPQVTAVYDLTAFDSEDGYNLFLSGGTPLLTITSPLSKSTRELVIFRDSFGSSIAPLFLEEYRKVTLVDLRYLSSRLLAEKVDFTGKDVLVLYSSLILNSSIQLK